MHTDLPLGRDVAYPRHYDPGLLFPIARRDGRAAIGLATDAPLPFAGHDRWQAWELGWLDLRGKPVVATATLQVPYDSPNLVESKSLKLYLNSFNAERVASADVLRATVISDLSRSAGAPVGFAFGVPAIAAPQGEDLDAQEIGIDGYGPPDRTLLVPASARAAGAGNDPDRDPVPDAPGRVDEVLHSNLLKSNCPVTGQPDWASITIAYRGARIDRAGLLRYLVSYRDHAGFHEQCVEQVFVDILAQCRPEALCVEARYTRRGGLDINPLRATPGWPLPSAARDARQ